MKKPTVLRLWTLLCTLIVLNACQKETATTGQQVNQENATIRAGGALPDDAAHLAKVPLLVSADFQNLTNARGGKGVKQTDSDGDGIADVNDACPIQKETVNGYQDTDGCPDTAPAPTAADSDGDGIADSVDACPTQKETANGYQDSDGCPDTVPDTDGDGIVDTQDACPNEKETINGFEDADGCPDTAPVVIPPTTLPSSYQLVTPPVGNQGNEWSCVAFAIAYGARSIEQYYKTNAGSYSFTTNIFSPEYAYNQTKFSDCGSGTSITMVLDLMQNQGVATWQSMPYSDANGCALQPDASQRETASNYKISSYVKIANSDQVAIKSMIASKHPVIATLIMDDSFVNAKSGFVWKTYSGSGSLPHTMLICGYDDTKHAFKVMNSWGTGWGDAGFSWVDYDFFTQKSSYYTYAIQ